jgi:hypothetical protein
VLLGFELGLMLAKQMLYHLSPLPALKAYTVISKTALKPVFPVQWSEIRVPFAISPSTSPSVFLLG